MMARRFLKIEPPPPPTKKNSTTMPLLCRLDNTGELRSVGLSIFAREESSPYQSEAVRTQKKRGS